MQMILDVSGLPSMVYAKSIGPRTRNRWLGLTAVVCHDIGYLQSSVNYLSFCMYIRLVWQFKYEQVDPYVLVPRPLIQGEEFQV